MERVDWRKERMNNYFKDLNNVDTKEMDVINMCGFNGIQIGVETIRTEVEVIARNLKTGKPVGKDEVNGKMIFWM